MAPSTRHEAHDQLFAQIQLTQRRLEDFAIMLEDLGEEIRETFTDQATALQGRCRELKSKIASWDEVEIGIPSAVTDLSAAVDTMEADVEATKQSIGPLYELAMDQQTRAWRSRLDSLRLQAQLGAMEARDDLDDLSHRLDRARAGVLVELQKAAGDSKDVVIDLRDDVEEVLADVRHAVERAVKALVAG